MTVRHHPSEATLIGYASGALAETAAVVVAIHLSRCAECRSQVEVARMVGGALLDALPLTPLAPDALAHALARLDRPAKPAIPERVVARDLAAGLACPAALLPYPIGGWRWIGPGLHQIQVLKRRPDGTSLRLLRIAPNTAMPHHTHGRLELTCVLSGSISDDSGTFGPGDVAEGDESVTHEPVAGPEADCVCVVALDGALRFSGMGARIIQRWLGI